MSGVELSAYSKEIADAREEFRRAGSEDALAAPEATIRERHVNKEEALRALVYHRDSGRKSTPSVVNRYEAEERRKKADAARKRRAGRAAADAGP